MRRRPESEIILLAVEDAAIRDVVRQGLQVHGYRVLEAHSGDDALSRCAQHGGPIHLLLADAHLNVIDGQPLAESVRISRPDMKVVCISSLNYETLAKKGKLPAGTHFLQKPFSSTLLAAKVRAVLDE
ncbi:MAG: response regulator [Gemmataceae bacterium]|nr:response regulator [Gemmataceae bacterium]